MRARFLFPSSVAVALLLAACAGDRPSGHEAPLSTTTSASTTTVFFDETGSVRQVFDRYKAAILSSDGAAAVQLVTRGSLDHYERLRVMAMEAGPDEIRRSSISDRMMIGMLRLRVSRDTLAGMSGRDLCRHAVEQGWIGREGTLSSDIGEIHVSGDEAAAVAVVNGSPTPLRFRFLKEDASWKFDLAALIRVVDATLPQVARQAGMSEDEFILESLELATGQPVTEEVWEKPAA